MESLCKEAENYGIKVIVDVVANHLAGDHSRIEEDLKPSKYWHTLEAVLTGKQMAGNARRNRYA